MNLTKQKTEGSGPETSKFSEPTVSYLRRFSFCDSLGNLTFDTDVGVMKPGELDSLVVLSPLQHPQQYYRSDYLY